MNHWAYSKRLRTWAYEFGLKVGVVECVKRELGTNSITRHQFINTVKRLLGEMWTKERMPGIPGYESVIDFITTREGLEPIRDYWVSANRHTLIAEWNGNTIGDGTKQDRDVVGESGELSVYRYVLDKTGHELKRCSGKYDPDFKHPNGVNHLEVKTRMEKHTSLRGKPLMVGDWRCKTEQYQPGDIGIYIFCDECAYWCETPTLDKWVKTPSPTRPGRYNAAIPWRYWRRIDPATEPQFIALLTKGDTTNVEYATV